MIARNTSVLRICIGAHACLALDPSSGRCKHARVSGGGSTGSATCGLAPCTWSLSWTPLSHVVELDRSCTPAADPTRSRLDR
ncbi:hypothetical protein PR001_g14914 [Phytophthora rubi]|uniref:Uncharacterized protein n=1 Tax=Phytophthora rubi TaxID=129364 RepID=A0A6A3NMA5_9STRA|nr:hypothetical protein PR001_g14914 [Phytophthora rubi]KAE9042761.1 hypothetical protein PR002_g3724 [Phytophthora rubi]